MLAWKCVLMIVDYDEKEDDRTAAASGSDLDCVSLYGNCVGQTWADGVSTAPLITASVSYTHLTKRYRTARQVSTLHGS